MTFNKLTKYATITTVLDRSYRLSKIPCVCLQFIPTPRLASYAQSTLNNFFLHMEKS